MTNKGTEDPGFLPARLAALIGSEHVLTDAAAMSPYLTDYRGNYHGRALAVVKPANTQEVADIVRLCLEAGVPIVPQGGNTGLCGGATPLPDGQALLVNLSRLNRIRALDVANDTLCVEAGCTLAAVQKAAAAAGISAWAISSSSASVKSAAVITWRSRRFSR